MIVNTYDFKFVDEKYKEKKPPVNADMIEYPKVWMKISKRLEE